MGKYTKSYQGIFNPQNKEKYKGTSPIFYRSGLERNLMLWLDRNEKVTQWGSETVVIPYQSPKDGRIHRYFVDFVIYLQTDQGIKKYLIEVKPDSQTKPPNPNSRANKKNKMYEQIMWAVNCSKWESAKKWCEKKGFEFVVLSEKHLK